MADIQVKSEVVGIVARVIAAVGQRVSEGDEVILLESMKMEIPVSAPSGGVVSAILVEEGQSVGEGQTLITLARA